jgi:hypothetical protein
MQKCCAEATKLDSLCSTKGTSTSPECFADIVRSLVDEWNGDGTEGEIVYLEPSAA